MSGNIEIKGVYCMKNRLIGIIIPVIALLASCVSVSKGNREAWLNGITESGVVGKWLWVGTIDIDGIYNDWLKLESFIIPQIYLEFNANGIYSYIPETNGERIIDQCLYRIEGNEVYNGGLIENDFNRSLNHLLKNGGFHTYTFDASTPNVLTLKSPKLDFTLVFNRFDVQIEEFTTLEQADGIESALQNASKKIITSLSKGKNIAISNVSAEEKDYSDFIANELEVILLDAGFVVLDRSQLDVIRQEQNLQLSGAVADNEIISIGKFSGANFVISGLIDGSGPTRRLRLRLLDVETARVITAASERF